MAHKGDGTTSSFAVNFAFKDAASLEVVLRDDATRQETVLTPTSNYTVTGGGGSSGSVKLRVPPPSGKTVIIRQRAQASATATAFYGSPVFLGAVAAGVVVVGLLLWFLVFAPSDIAAPPTASNLTEVQEGELTIGSADAPITMIEYASLGCPHCAEFAEQVLPQIKTNYIDKGLVRLVLRDFPHTAQAMSASLVTACVPRDSQIAFMDVLMRTQELWAFTENAKEGLITIAKRASLTREQVEQCLKNDSLFQSIRASQDRANKELGIDGIPSFFINGRKMGPAPYAQFDQLFKSILTQLGHPSVAGATATPQTTTTPPSNETPSTTPPESDTTTPPTP
jgi:protein-disulfide isomerase